MDPHSFYLLDPDPDPHSEKLLDPNPQKMNADPQPWGRLRRINTEEEAKIIVAVCWEEFIQFLAALANLPKTILKKRINSSLSFISSLVQFILIHPIQKS